MLLDSVICLTLLVVSADAAPKPEQYFTIQVIDEITQRGVPLVKLTTTNNVSYFTDSAGIVAFYEPQLMNQTVFFEVASPGYEFPKDGLGSQGKGLAIKPGGSATLKLKRQQLAQRLYRVTGEGIYRDTVLVGRKAPIRQPLLNAQVMGSDSVVTAIYRGKLHWFWGDTNRPSYPLGNFDTPGAISELPGQGGLDPEAGVDLTYFADPKGFARPMAPLPGKGPTWISGAIVLRDGERERLFTSYMKVAPPMTIYERGLAEYNDDHQQFEKVVAFDTNAPVQPGGVAMLHKFDGVEFVVYTQGIALVRVKAVPEQLRDPANCESYTYLKEGSTLASPEVDRGEDGKLRYAWKQNTPTVDPEQQAKHLKAGLVREDELRTQLRNIDDGKLILPHGGSVSWNAYRQRWGMIFTESKGLALSGNVWYAEADELTGPWVYARQVATHGEYTVYNPLQHPYFAKDGGRTIFFEGTYTTLFSTAKVPTPRYDYNQLMYKLDLGDPRLPLPAPFYAFDSGPMKRFGRLSDFDGARPQKDLAFLALDRPGIGTVPLYVVETELGDPWYQLRRPGGSAEPVIACHVLPPDLENPPENVQPMYELVSGNGLLQVYSLDPGFELGGFIRSKKPLCYVWRNPWAKVEAPATK